MRIVAFLLRLGPVLFGVGFLAPVIAASIDSLQAQTPAGVPPLAIGLAIGMALGCVAMRRRTWI